MKIKNGETEIETLQKPLKIIELKSYEQKIDLEKFGDNYIKLKEEIKIKNKENWKLRYNELNLILTQNNLNDENLLKINKTLIRKINPKFTGIRI